MIACILHFRNVTADMASQMTDDGKSENKEGGTHRPTLL
jgi:hypothetical protein